MASKSSSTLPSPKDLALLSPEKIELILQAAKDKGDRQLQYASLSMKCGTACLISSLVLFTFLVMQGHDTAAAVILGTAIVGLLSKIILARLD